MINSAFPIITSPDLPRLLAFYRDRLGGTQTYAFDGPDGRPAFVALDRGAATDRPAVG